MIVKFWEAELEKLKLQGPIWLMQPIPYFGETLEKEKWICEPKIDGWRLQIIKYESGKVEFWGRRLERKPNWTEKLSFLIKPVEKMLPPGSLLDAELTTEKGRRFIPSIFAKKKKVKPLIYVFDIVFYKGEFVGGKMLSERRKILEKLSFKNPFYLLPFKKIKDLKEDLWEEVKKGEEGIVIKRLDSLYLVAKDGPMATQDWRKIKPSF